MELKQDQELVASDFEHWLLGTQGHYAGLWASAGFGKSWLVKHLVNKVILPAKYNIILSSLTHSATDVLAQFTGMESNTLHSVMGWVPMVNKETGEEYLSTREMRQEAQDPDDALGSGDLLLIDEAGFMGHSEVALLHIDCREKGYRVLFVGDDKQCFPVMKDDEELCVPAYEAPQTKFHLTIPKRVDKDDPIYKLSLVYRAAVDGARQPRLRTMLNKDGSGKGVYVVDDIEDAACEAFVEARKNGTEQDVKVLAFTNKRCLTLNRKIRRRVKGLESGIPVVGEEMVSNTTITSATRDAILIKNNQLLVVDSVEQTESYGLEGAFIQFKDIDGEDIKEIVFVPESPDRLVRRLKQIASEALALRDNGGEPKELWHKYYALKEGCADIRFTYAITVNKAQGKTLHHVLIDMYDVNSCREREQRVRLAYTAVSRASSKLTIEGELDE